MGFFARKLERRSSLAYPDEFVSAWFGGSDAKSGISVTPDSALTNTAILASVERLSRTVASLPFMVYRRLQDGGKERDPGHRLWTPLHDQPNEEHTALEFYQYMMASVLLRGNSYSYIELSQGGDLLNLWPLNPAKVSVERKAGRLLYTWTPSSAPQRIFPAELIHHVRGLSTNGVTGLSPIGLASESIGLGLAAEEFAARFFASGAAPRLALTYPSKLDPEVKKRLKESWDEANAGKAKAWKAAVLEEGLSVEKIGVDQRDAQFIELRKFQIRDAARIYNLQPHLIGDLDNATFTNIESQGIEYVVYTLGFWLRAFEQATHRDLFTPAERKTHFAEFLVEGLLRGDVQSRGEFYSKLFQMGAISANEIRSRENLNPRPGGDVFYVPLNFAPVDERGIQVTPFDSGGFRSLEHRALAKKPARYGLRAGFAKLYAEAARRTLRSERREVMKEARRQFVTRDTPSFLLWLDGFYRDHEPFIAQQVAPIYTAQIETAEPSISAEVGKSSSRGEALDAFTLSLIRAHAARHARSSAGQLRKVIEDAPTNPLSAIDERFEHWEGEGQRAEQIGRRSAVQAGEAAARFIFAAAGFGLVWHTTGESCDFCNALDGQRVGGAVPFLQDGQTLHAGTGTPLTVSSSISHAPLHDGCDCFVSPG